MENKKVKYSQYTYKFYLNANHSININGNRGEIHPHTWEIQIDIIQVADSFVQFSTIEKSVEEVLSDYQDKYLNDLKPFNVINPTLENIGEFFNLTVGRKLQDEGWLLLRLEISETPSRSYIIDSTIRENM